MKRKKVPCVRVQLNLNQTQNDAVEIIAAQLGESKAEVIRRAIRLLEHMHHEHDAGAQIMLTYPDDRPVTRLVFI